MKANKDFVTESILLKARFRLSNDNDENDSDDEKSEIFDTVDMFPTNSSELIAFQNAIVE